MSWYIWSTYHRPWCRVIACKVLVIVAISPRWLRERNTLIYRSYSITKWSFPPFSPSVWKNWWLEFALLLPRGWTRQTTEHRRLNVCEDKGLSCDNPTVPLSGCPPSCFSRQPFLMSTQPVNLSVTWHVAIYTHTRRGACILCCTHLQWNLSLSPGGETLRKCSSLGLHKAMATK